ncbi:MAG: TlpA family protein disulfide reductase, partial [Sulfurovum sp.]
YTLIMREGKLLPDLKSKPILLINLFDIHDHASAAQVPYLTKLQNKYGNRLTVLGIPTNQTMDEEELRTFIDRHQIDYFISYESSYETLINLFSELLKSDGLTTPTTLLYHQGETGPIYEGAVPVEMITHDILMITKE